MTTPQDPNSGDNAHDRDPSDGTGQQWPHPGGYSYPPLGGEYPPPPGAAYPPPPGGSGPNYESQPYESQPYESQPYDSQPFNPNPYHFDPNSPGAYGTPPQYGDHSPYGGRSPIPGQHQYPPYGYYGAPPPTNGMAIASLVTSLTSLVCCGLFAFVGIILGVMARKQIRQTGERGDGLAIAGIVVGSILTGLIVLYFGAFLLAIPAGF
ncbi:DUF4190 domain-containing protein [Hoyosella rhizosphaerae]|uniref:DUF4190 domain-containing protein n=1 Tax=Hoyosella rhizosphaerae TaxID=1755582 RepID=A0A916X8T4_9ACTN|nr:DUF4190 domain-containing protein [Hoyosella rhizosphaerae]MBN4927257.1 DUF4190 domain-containing protein [Hoyosella rhizosphaerae]GGC52716.1 hypothetical protein GCM10011410_01290 [Hoyosella rhizosphaerae]